MTRMELYEAWAPPESVWSRWAKPVLFAEMPLTQTSEALGDALVETTGLSCPAPDERTALVVELPGVQSVVAGADLARRGYRPVPLFNASSGPAAILDVERIKAALRRYAPTLGALSIPADAPPAFLLDSERLAGSRIVAPGRFDNRWVVLPQDFPSGNFLLSQDIRSAALLRINGERVSDDLAHVLRRWQEAGMPLRRLSTTPGAKCRPLEVPRPSRFRALWYRALAVAGLRRNSAGGFGGIVPLPSSGGGYG